MYDRLSDRVCDKISDALIRTLALGEQVETIDFALAVLPTPQGLVTVALVYVAIKSPILGESIANTDVIVDLGQLTQAGIDNSVRTCLDAIRSRRAALLVPTNGHASR